MRSVFPGHRISEADPQGYCGECLRGLGDTELVGCTGLGGGRAGGLGASRLLLPSLGPDLSSGVTQVAQWEAVLPGWVHPEGVLAEQSPWLGTASGSAVTVHVTP